MEDNGQTSPTAQESELEAVKQELEGKKKWNQWFYGRVKWMRECQKSYFSNRKKLKNEQKGRSNPMELERLEEEVRLWFKRSTEVENEIDAEIRRIEAALIKRSEPVQMMIEMFDCEEVKP